MKTKTLLKTSIAFFSILALTALVIHHIYIKDMVFGSFGGLMLILIGFCLLELKSIEYNNQASKLRRLRYASALLVIAFIINIFLFVLALSSEVKVDKLVDFFPLMFASMFVIISIIGFRSLKLYPGVKSSKKVTILCIFLGLMFTLGFMVVFFMRLFK